MKCDLSDTWNAKCDIKLTCVTQVAHCETQTTQCVTHVTQYVAHFVTHVTPHCQVECDGDLDEPKSLLACRLWQISWLVGPVALAGLAQRRLETTKVADLQGGSGHLVPQECLQMISIIIEEKGHSSDNLRHGLLSVGGRLLVLRV